MSKPEFKTEEEIDEHYSKRMNSLGNWTMGGFVAGIVLAGAGLIGAFHIGKYNPHPPANQYRTKVENLRKLKRVSREELPIRAWGDTPELVDLVEKNKSRNNSLGKAIKTLEKSVEEDVEEGAKHRKYESWNSRAMLGGLYGFVGGLALAFGSLFGGLYLDTRLGKEKKKELEALGN